MRLAAWDEIVRDWRYEKWIYAVVLELVVAGLIIGWLFH